MTGPDEEDEPRLDEVGEWSRFKLEILGKYADVYSKLVGGRNLHSLYIDGFAGAGRHKMKGTGEVISGSPEIALNLDPGFDELHFVELNPERASALRRLVRGRTNAYVHEGDCNVVLLDKVFPLAKWEDYRRAFCLLDPYGMHLKWEVLKAAGSMRSVEVLLNFPIADVNRNALRRDQSLVRPKDAQRMTDLWGGEEWREKAYAPEQTLFGEEVTKIPGNVAIVEAFREHLKKDAGFKFVPRALAMRHPRGAVVYYLVFAGNNETGSRIASDVFRKYEAV